ncbi:MAG: hypothetical protein AABZ12_06550 [Planctomycetota bacterium]
MNYPSGRMSPITALFMGIFGCGAIAIAGATVIVLRGMSLAESQVGEIIGFAGGLVDGLPELLSSLPPALADVVHDRRAPEYSGNVEVAVRFIPDEESGGIRPALTVKNTGSEVVSMLAIRVAALDATRGPIRDWTEVVATPLAIDDDWRGPLMPGATRHVVLHRCRSIPSAAIDRLTPATEISDIRVWSAAKDQI